MYTQYSKITFETGILRIGREQDWHDGHMAGDTIGLWPGASARSPWPVPSEPRGTALLAGPAVSSEGPFFPHAFPIRPRSREQKQTSSVWLKMKRFTPAAEMGTWRPQERRPFQELPSQPGGRCASRRMSPHGSRVSEEKATSLIVGFWLYGLRLLSANAGELFWGPHSQICLGVKHSRII